MEDYSKIEFAMQLEDSRTSSEHIFKEFHEEFHENFVQGRNMCGQKSHARLVTSKAKKTSHATW